MFGTTGLPLLLSLVLLLLLLLPLPPLPTSLLPPLLLPTIAQWRWLIALPRDTSGCRSSVARRRALEAMKRQSWLGRCCRLDASARCNA